MKKKLMFIVAGAVVAVALVFAVPAVFAQQANPPATPGTPATPPAIPHERHPAIRRAIFALKAAKADLEHADHDFGGHRAAALDECDKAIAQLQAALQYDQQ